MPYHVHPLYYAIDNWHQLVNARSNYDPTLRVKVTDYIQSMVLQGQKVEVIHPQYGIVFATLVNATGRLVDNSSNPGLTNEQVLQALRQLGFYVEFKTNIALDTATRLFLTAALSAGYTHIRRLLWRKAPGITKSLIVCFNETTHPELVNQFIKPVPILDGDIMRVSPNNNPSLDFSWLFDVPLQIDSILTDNL